MTEQQYKAEELRFEVLGLKLAAKSWGKPGGMPVLALHGWLDNANSFDRLAPGLADCHLVALDFAGHGMSAHRPAGVHYHSLWDIQDALAVADALGWSKFSVLGHSMGAGIASELAAMFPERVELAVMVDGFVATGGVTEAERLQQNREAIEKMLHHSAREPRVFESTEHMAQRVTQATDQTLDAARILVERGARSVAGGFTWRTDPRIRFPTPLRHSLEQINLLVENSLAPALLLVADQGDKWYQGEVALRQAHHPNLEVVHLEGPHHLHLENAHYAEVLRLIREHFNLLN